MYLHSLSMTFGSSILKTMPTDGFERDFFFFFFFFENKEMLVSFDKDKIRVMIYHSSLHVSNWPGCSNTISHQCKTCSTSNLEQSTIYRIEIWKGMPRKGNSVGNGKAFSICNSTSWCFCSHSPCSFPAGSIRFDNLNLLSTIIYQLLHSKQKANSLVSQASSA